MLPLVKKYKKNQFGRILDKLGLVWLILAEICTISFFFQDTKSDFEFFKVALFAGKNAKNTLITKNSGRLDLNLDFGPINLDIKFWIKVEKIRAAK